MKAGKTGAAARALGYQSLSATFQCEQDRAEILAEEAMRLGSSSGSLGALISAHTALARVREYQNRLQEAVEHGREWLRLTLELGDRLRAVAACAFGLADPLLRLGRLDEAWAILEQGLEISNSVGGTAYSAPVALRRIEVLRRRGKLDQAEAEALRAPPDLSPDFVVYRAPFIAPLRAAQGREGEAERLWEEALARAASVSPIGRVTLLLARAGYLAEQGRPGEAGAVLDELRPSLRQTTVTVFKREFEALEARIGRRAHP